MLNKDALDAAEFVLNELSERAYELTTDEHVALSLTADVLLRSGGIEVDDAESICAAASATGKSIFWAARQAYKSCGHGERMIHCEATH